MSIVNNQFSKTAVLGLLFTGFGMMGLRTFTKLSPTLKGPLTSSFVGAGISTISVTFVKYFQLNNKSCKNVEEISLMAATFFGTFFASRAIGPKLLDQRFHQNELILYSLTIMVAAILADASSET